jgi:DNA-binding NtrC family response regulator
MERTGFSESRSTDGARLLGPSAAMDEVRRQVAAAAGALVVLIRGERGAGKATAARAVHAAAAPDQPIVEIDCAEAELLALPTAGTVLLREVAALGPAAQAAVLALPADVRVVATTAHDLAKLAAHDRFSVALADRLGAVVIDVPPLRDRPADVADLCRHFAAIAARRERREPHEPDPAALAALQAHPWPRNVRELRNFVDRAYTVAGPGNPLRTGLIEPWLRATAVAGDPAADPVAATVEALAGQPLADIEKKIILTTLQQFRGHRIKTAASLGIGVRTLGIKLKRWRDEGEPVDVRSRAVG